MLTEGKPYISETAKTNSKLAKKQDNEENKMHEFFYWLGYYNGQDSVTNDD